jgi:hypothetical protein
MMTNAGTALWQTSNEGLVFRTTTLNPPAFSWKYVLDHAYRHCSNEFSFRSPYVRLVFQTPGIAGFAVTIW